MSGEVNGSGSGQTNETNVLMTDIEKFRRSLKESIICTDNLHETEVDTP